MIIYQPVVIDDFFSSKLCKPKSKSFSGLLPYLFTSFVPGFKTRYNKNTAYIIVSIIFSN